MGGGVNAVSGGALLSITVLPIELVSFTAIERQGQVQMNWKTATEQSNTGFEIQRASDAYFDQWDKLGFVKGQGTIYTEQHYSFVDPQPINGINYYRLKQIDFDGSHEFSNVVSVSRTNKLKQIQFYPNPRKWFHDPFYRLRFHRNRFVETIRPDRKAIEFSNL